MREANDLCLNTVLGSPNLARGMALGLNVRSLSEFASVRTAAIYPNSGRPYGEVLTVAIRGCTLSSFDRPFN
jgi:hypothetical protein